MRLTDVDPTYAAPFAKQVKTFCHVTVLVNEVQTEVAPLHMLRRPAVSHAARPRKANVLARLLAAFIRSRRPIQLLRLRPLGPAAAVPQQDARPIMDKAWHKDPVPALTDVVLVAARPSTP